MGLNLVELLETKIVCGDGAMGTELIAAGVPLERCLEETNVTDPDIVRRIHEAYVNAGSQLLETNTFGANGSRLKRHGLEKRVAELNTRAVELAREASRGRDVLVAGSVGPLAQSAPGEDAEAAPPEELFQEQLTALLDAKVDAIFFETFVDFQELKIGLAQLRELDSKIPTICSVVCSEEGRLASSLPVVRAFRELLRLGADIVGVNCVTGPHAMLQILQRVPTDFLVSAYPNAGYPRYHEGRFLYNAAPEYFGISAPKFVEEGARLIGGCCGVGPAHIAQVARAIADLTPVRTKPTVTWRSEAEPLERRRPAETSILDLMAAGQTVIVTELDPPKNLDLERYFLAARRISDAGSDAITLADNSLAILRISNLALGAILKQQYNIMPLLHISCRDKNLLALQSELMGIATLGIRHVLPLTGDPAKFGDQPGASSVYDVNSIQLMQIIAEMNRGFNFAGKSLKHPTDFVFGCTFNPNAKNLDAQINRLERKLAAGASYVMTQPVFDKGLVQIMYERTKHLKVPILTGIWPLLSGRQAEFLHHEVPGIIIPDSVRAEMAGTEGAAGKQAGLQIAKEVVSAVLEYFPGVYLITPFLAYDTTAELAAFVRKLGK
jgi:homocysteine S-methyltransferase